MTFLRTKQLAFQCPAALHLLDLPVSNTRLSQCGQARGGSSYPGGGPRHFPERHLSPGAEAGPQLQDTFPTQHFHEAAAAPSVTHWMNETCVRGPSLGTKSTQSGCEQMPEVLQGFWRYQLGQSWMKRLPGGGMTDK